MMLKVGDMLLCKKNNYVADNIEYTDIFITGYSYKVLHIDKEFYVLSSDDGEYLLKEIRDYFYTPQELRKLKLEKLNKNNEINS